jgi:hypothetical protein
MDEEGRMLFHIKQTHTPENCPYGKGGSRSLFDRESKNVKIIGVWLAFPAHTNYLIVETDDIGHLHNFLLPGPPGRSARSPRSATSRCRSPTSR